MPKDRNDPPAAAERRRRLAEALRANLKRRKSQSRDRRDAAPARPTPDRKRD